MLFDLGNVLVNLYEDWKKDRELQAWIKLGLSSFYSAYLGLTGAWGAALVAHQSPWVAFGMGLMGSAVSTLTVLLNSPQARSLILSSPQSIVTQYQAQDEVVMRGKDAPK